MPNRNPNYSSLDATNMERYGTAPTFDPAAIGAVGGQPQPAYPQDDRTGRVEAMPAVTESEEGNGGGKTGKKSREKPLVAFGVACVAIFLAALIFVSSGSASIDTGAAAQDALANQVSTSLSLGTVLLAEDQNIGQQDYTITHDATGQDNTNIWIWDYAAEDGDYVQVLVEGVPVGEPFMIKHKPVLIQVSLPGLTGAVQVKGVRDGGGGITYAVRYELNNTTYFNSAPENEFNTYTFALAP